MPICWTKSSVKCVRSPEILNLCHSSYNWMNYPEQNIQSKLNIHERQIDDGILRMRRGNKLVMLTGEPRVGSGSLPSIAACNRLKPRPNRCCRRSRLPHPASKNVLSRWFRCLVLPRTACRLEIAAAEAATQFTNVVRGEVGRGGEPAAANGSRPMNCSTTAANPRNRSAATAAANRSLEKGKGNGNRLSGLGCALGLRVG